MVAGTIIHAVLTVTMPLSFAARHNGDFQGRKYSTPANLSLGQSSSIFEIRACRVRHSAGNSLRRNRSRARGAETHTVLDTIRKVGAPGS